MSIRQTFLPLAMLLALPSSAFWPAVAVAEDVPATSSVASPLPSFTELMKKASPSVVNISAARASWSDDTQFFDLSEVPEPFRRFFDQAPFGASPGWRRPLDEVRSLGSGFVIARDGYILTNAHVVDGAERIKVKFSDRREMDARLVGTDKRTDIALLKVDAHDLPVLPLGNSDQLQAGEWVAAIGSPFGFDQSITAGIVSATDRTLSGDGIVPFIQTDVAINPGNSGGPLLNLNGEVVGINSQILTRSGGYMGLSFAIPANVALSVADQLKQDGRVHRAWLGVSLQALDGRLARAFGRSATQGALVASVVAGGPAEHAGVRPGDIILKVNGQQIDSVDRVPRIVAGLKPGQNATLDLWRRDKNISLSVALVEHVRALEDKRPEAEASPQHRAGGRLGIKASALDARTLAPLGITHGVKVEAVDDRSMAAQAGLMPGDVLVELDGQSVVSPDQLKHIADALPTRHAISMRVIRDGQVIYMALEINNG